VKIFVKSKVRLTNTGKAGAALLVAGPTMSMISYWRFLDEISPGGRANLTYMLQYGIGVWILLGLLGAVLLFVGRSYEHEATIERE